MTQKELDEMEIEAQEHVFRYFAPDADPKKLVKKYKSIKNRIPHLVILTPPVLIFSVYCLAEKEWPDWGMIKLVGGIFILLEGVRLFLVWFVNKATIEAMKAMIEYKKLKEGETGGNGESNNKGSEDNGGFNGS